MNCVCGATVRSCVSCGRELLSADELLNEVEGMRLGIGRFAGKTIRDLIREDPLVWRSWAKKKGSTPHMKIMNAYAKFRESREDLVKLFDKGPDVQTKPAVKRPKFLPPPEEPAPTSHQSAPKIIRVSVTESAETGGTGSGEVRASLPFRTLGTLLSSLKSGLANPCWRSYCALSRESLKAALFLLGRRSCDAVVFVFPYFFLLLALLAVYPADSCLHPRLPPRRGGACFWTPVGVSLVSLGALFSIRLRDLAPPFCRELVLVSLLLPLEDRLLLLPARPAVCFAV